MFGLGDMWILAGVVLVLVLAGIHVAVALGVTAVLGIVLMTHDFGIVTIFIGNTAYEALRDYVFAVLPLFMLMGEFLRKCGAAADLYALCNRMMRFIPGRLAIATVFVTPCLPSSPAVRLQPPQPSRRLPIPP